MTVIIRSVSSTLLSRISINSWWDDIAKWGMFAECLRESAAADLQQTGISGRDRGAACDKVPLILYGKACNKQGQERTAKQGGKLSSG